MNINTAVGEIRTHYLNLPKDDLTEGGRFTAEVLEKLVATERAKILSEVDGWLVDEFTEEDEWICPKCGNTVGEGYYCRNDRSKPVKETRKWEDGWQEAKNVLRAELRAKLNQLKGSE